MTKTIILSCLLLLSGATLRAQESYDRYYQNLPKAVPCISATNSKNVSISGEGIIDGNGEYRRPVKRTKVSDTE